MAVILRNYYILILIILAFSFIGKLASANEAPRLSYFVGIPAATKSDWRWDKLSPPSQHLKSQWNSIAMGHAPEELVPLVNKWVNEKLKYVEDTGDVWSSANESLARGYGDCDDFAIAKYQILVSLGFPEKDLFLLVGRDEVVHQTHAVLLVHLPNENVILDNMTNNIISEALAIKVLFPMFAYSKQGSWVFGIDTKMKK